MISSTAGMMIDPDNPKAVYALNGSGGHAALLHGTYDGKTWIWQTCSTDKIATNAGRPYDHLAVHPRSIGQLMVPTKANGKRYFFVGNYKTGVIVSTDPCGTWTRLPGIPDSIQVGKQSIDLHIRGLAVDTNGTLWVATRENGMYQCPSGAYVSNGSCTPDPSSPKHVEEVRTVGTDVSMWPPTPTE